jgi:hypothetical protein
MRAFLRRILEQWRIHTVLVMNAALKTDNARMKEIVDNKSHSIWNQTKPELIETAIRELGMTRPQASKETVVVLRELLRRARKEAREQKDPLLQLPVGLEKLQKKELQQECTNRGISQMWMDGKVQKDKTRPQMILDIREDVTRRGSNVPPDPVMTEDKGSASSKDLKRTMRSSLTYMNVDHDGSWGWERVKSPGDSCG